MIETVLEYENFPYEAEVELLLTTDEEIRRINKEHRQIDRATDVLSFPMLDFETPGILADVEKIPDAFDPESGELILGDIVISKESVISQAEK